MNHYLEELANKIIDNLDDTLLDFKDKTILITGANGLIGGFLADFFYYLNEEYDYNCKILLTSLSKTPERLKKLIYQKNVIYHSRDLTANNWFFEEIDYCFYCAGYAQPGKFLSNTNKTYSLNSDSMRNTFNSIFHNNKKAKVLFLSSSEIYALNNVNEPHKETDSIKVSLGHKRISYIMGKLAGEYNINLIRESGFNAKSARVSLCYGPGHVMNDIRVMSDLTRKGIENETIDLFDDGSSFRKYQHISDCCIMMINILLNGKEEVYNVGGKEEITIYDMTKIIGDKFSKEVIRGKVNNEVATSAPKKVSISLDRYDDEFGKFEFVSFENGMENYLNWYIDAYRKYNGN